MLFDVTGCKFYFENKEQGTRTKEKGKKYIAAHFLAENIPKNIPYTDILRVQNQENHLSEKKELIESRFLIYQTTDSKSRNFLITKRRKAARKFKFSQLMTRNILRKMKKPIFVIKQLTDPIDHLFRGW